MTARNGRPCSVCRHGKLAQIDRDLQADGLTLATIVGRYRLSKSALIRHRQKHLPGPRMAETGSWRPGTHGTACGACGAALGPCPVPEPEDLPALTDETIVELSWRRTLAGFRYADKAEADGDIRTAATANANSHRMLVELLAKKFGVVADGPVVDARTQVLNVALGQASEEALRALVSGLCYRCQGALDAGDDPEALGARS